MPGLVSEAALATVASDGLADHYSAVANDRNIDARKRKAAGLFSTAERYLDDGVRYDEAVESAKQALHIFQDIGEQECVIDAMRLVIRACDLKAQLLKYEGVPLHKEEIKHMRREAASLARDGLAHFEERGNIKGEAAMLLAFAELNFDMKGSKMREEALRAATEAMDLFNDVGEKKMEGRSLLLISKIQYKVRGTKPSRQAANAALAIFQDLGDRKGEADAHHSIGCSYFGELTEDGLKAFKKAAGIYRQLGDKRSLACELLSVAHWHHRREDPHEAVGPAKEALALFQHVAADGGSVGGWVSHALNQLVTAYLETGETELASNEAREGLAKVRESGDKRQIALVLDTLYRVLLESDEPEEALNVAEEAIEIARELKDRRWEANFLQGAFVVHMDTNRPAEALKVAEEVQKIAKDREDLKEEANACMMLLQKANIKTESFDAAVEASKQAVSLSRKSEDKIYEAASLMNLSRSHACGGNVSKAMEAATEASEIYHQEDDKRGEAGSYSLIAELHRMSEDIDDAIHYAKKGQEIFKELGDKKGEAAVVHSFARIYMSADKFKEAARAANEARQLARPVGDRQGEVEMLCTFVEATTAMLSQGGEKKAPGTRAFKEGWEKSLRSAKEAVALALRLKRTDMQGVTQYWLGSVYLMNGKATEATQAAEEAIKCFKKTKDVSGETKATIILGEVEMMEGNAEKAMEILKGALEMAKSSKNEEDEKSINGILERLGVRQQQTVMMMPTDMGFGSVGAGGASAAPSAGGGAVSVYAAPDPKRIMERIGDMVLNMTGSDDEITADVPFMDVGMDSLASVEFRVALQKEFGVALPTTVMFNYPTPGGLTGYIAEECEAKQIAWG